ncbi:RNA polymerase sigma factor [Thalassotalea euphylliae]|uniref:RNA polymerase sigma factor n=1 Tax=Thalassotalea euphylliae TaxID=1655234 RepID=A0A3E0TMF0_9GAMM|nr:RNA polymerase sigma factor [Thalassotalea euphylliae]REL25741.1 RNA polymerase sigma factor [Thalassotalea euphylliae]
MSSPQAGAENRRKEGIKERNTQNSSIGEAERLAEQLNDVDQFFIAIEKRAYQMAMFAVRNHHDALDIVQESMIKLVERYLDKPSYEYKPLFYRIMQNKITDWHRHQKLRNLVFFWQSQNDMDEQENWLASASAVMNSQASPVDELQAKQLQVRLTKALASLSWQQQQCYLLRNWEGFSVADTAQIMGCSEGSIKTHFSRATAKLAELLADCDLAKEPTENAFNSVAKTSSNKPVHSNQKERQQGKQDD